MHEVVFCAMEIHPKYKTNFFTYYLLLTKWGLPHFRILKNKYGPPLWSSGQSSWLQIPEARVQFPALPEKKSSESGTGSTQLHEYN
jgi:hypothetical protein